MLDSMRDRFSKTTPLRAEDQLTIAFLQKFPRQCARLLESFTPQETATILSPLTPQVTAKVLEQSLPQTVLCIFQCLPENSIIEILSSMTPNSAVHILHFADRGWRAGLLGKMNFQKNALVLKAFSFEEGSVGRFVNPQVPILTGDRTVSDAIQWLQTQQSLMCDELYIVDHQQKLLGSIPIQELLIADIDDRLYTVADSTRPTLAASWSLEETYASHVWLHYHTLPVIDSNFLFLGTVSYSSLLAIQKVNPSTIPTSNNHSVESQPFPTPSNEVKTLPHFLAPTVRSYPSIHAPRSSSSKQSA